MKIGAPKELARGEARVALTPESAQQIQKLGHECLIESGAGRLAGFDDEDLATALRVIRRIARSLDGERRNEF